MIQFKRILKAVLKYRTSSVLTMISLVVSFVGIIVLTLYVSFEKSFDRFHREGSLVYRLETKAYGSSVPAAIIDVLSWWIFALAGVSALGIALLTVSWQSWRAATRNPVESLRYE